MPDDRLTLIRLETFEQEVKKSRFRALAGPIRDADTARDFLDQHRDGSAGHNCWAFRCGDSYRFSDDGEPGGTAGRPILQAIDGQGLDGVMVIVSRWFGGILLGSGGLVRAYGGTAAACLKAAERQTVIALRSVTVTCGFAEDARIRASLSHYPGSRVTDSCFGAEGGTLTIALPAARIDAFTRLVTDLSRGQARIDVKNRANGAGDLAF